MKVKRSPNLRRTVGTKCHALLRSTYQLCASAPGQCDDSLLIDRLSSTFRELYKFTYLLTYWLTYVLTYLIQRPHSFMHSYHHASTTAMLYWPALQKWRLTSCCACWMPPLVWSAVHTSLTVACRDSYILNYIGSMYGSGSRSSSASWCSPVCTTKHPSNSSTSASLYPVSPPDNTFALPTEVFSSCLAIVSAVTVGGLFVAGPAIWNWLPDSLRDPAISRDSFRRSLKTFLFAAYLCT